MKAYPWFGREVFNIVIHFSHDSSYSNEFFFGGISDSTKSLARVIICAYILQTLFKATKKLDEFNNRVVFWQWVVSDGEYSLHLLVLLGDEIWDFFFPSVIHIIRFLPVRVFETKHLQVLISSLERFRCFFGWKETFKIF